MCQGANLVHQSEEIFGKMEASPANSMSTILSANFTAWKMQPNFLKKMPFWISEDPIVCKLFLIAENNGCWAWCKEEHDNAHAPCTHVVFPADGRLIFLVALMIPMKLQKMWCFIFQDLENEFCVAGTFTRIVAAHDMMPLLAALSVGGPVWPCWGKNHFEAYGHEWGKWSRSEMNILMMGKHSNFVCSSWMEHGLPCQKRMDNHHGPCQHCFRAWLKACRTWFMAKTWFTHAMGMQHDDHLLEHTNQMSKVVGCCHACCLVLGSGVAQVHATAHCFFLQNVHCWFGNVLFLSRAHQKWWFAL